MSQGTVQRQHCQLTVQSTPLLLQMFSKGSFRPFPPHFQAIPILKGLSPSTYSSNAPQSPSAPAPVHLPPQIQAPMGA